MLARVLLEQQEEDEEEFVWFLDFFLDVFSFLLFFLYM